MSSKLTQPISKTFRRESLPPVINQKDAVIDGEKVGTDTPIEVSSQTERMKVVNNVTRDWMPNLKKSILAQGGNSIKSLNVKKVDSFVWNQDGLALLVESVIITIKNHKNEETSFKALVDAQNGKILKNWDQPIFDSVHPKDNFKVRIDPRYHNE